MNTMSTFNPCQTYLLLLACSSKAVVRVGAVGEVALTPGCYLYIGSARRHLAARLARHRRTQKPFHWHIDYLLGSGVLAIQEIWLSLTSTECALAGTLLQHPAVTVPHPRLGASDCRCPAHFLRWQEQLASIRHFLLALGLRPKSAT